MITGFNTDVQHEGQVYHVQTEDRGQSNPVLESLVYIGGTVIAKKLTPYAEQMSQGADEQIIAGLLKRQHQIIIAAIKTGRVRELIARYAGQASQGVRSQAADNQNEAKEAKVVKPKRSSGNHPKRLSSGPLSPPAPLPSRLPNPSPSRPPAMRTTSMLGSPRPPESATAKPAAPAQVTLDARPTHATARRATGTLDLDQVISDYLKRNNEQGKLDIRVITPSAFIAGKNAGLRVQVLFNAQAEPEAVVTIKIIGTAFKPQVHIGRAGRDGVANFSLALPAFTAGTAAIVIEAQSNRGRGELKHLIRRA
ncbi:MAG TPA: hypothetical protein VIS78_06115 [Blastocatellia bacterium]